MNVYIAKLIKIVGIAIVLILLLEGSACNAVNTRNIINVSSDVSGFTGVASAVINGNSFLILGTFSLGQNATSANPLTQTVRPEEGLIILDMNIPTSPKEIAYLKSDNAINFFKVYGTVLYVDTSDYLWMIDISNPSSPREIQKEYSITLVSDIVVSGHYLYAAEANADRIDVYDMDALKSPTLVSHLDIEATTLKYSGATLLALTDRGINIIDISTPEDPKDIGYIVNPNPPQDFPIHPNEIITGLIDMSINGDYVYIVAGLNKFIVANIAKPTSPVQIAVIDTKADGQEIITLGKYAYIFSIQFKQTPTPSLLAIVDISNPAKPKEIKDIKLPDSTALSMTELNNTIYIPDRESPTMKIISAE